jgi:hypothetical protein
MAGKQTVVRNDDVVSDEAIVTDVRSGHQEIFIANFRHTSVGAAAMDCAVLANDIVVPDFDLRLSFRRKRNILGRRTYDCAVPDEISATDRNFGFDYNVRLHDRFLADCYVRPNNGKGSDLGIGANFRIRIDDCGRMNFHVRHVSDLGFDLRIPVTTTRRPL